MVYLIQFFLLLIWFFYKIVLVIPGISFDGGMTEVEYNPAESQREIQTEIIEYHETNMIILYIYISELVQPFIHQKNIYIKNPNVSKKEGNEPV